MNSIFGEVIHSYTRKQALEDGVLIDISPMGKEAGFKYPVAITNTAFRKLEPSEMAKNFGQSTNGRLWDLLSILKVEAKKSNTREIIFYIVVLDKVGNKSLVKHFNMYFKCVIGPGDQAEPVLTIMLPNED